MAAKLETTIRKFDPEAKGTKLNLIFVDKCTQLQNIFKFKDMGPHMMRSNVVYLVTCNCGATYIGETERNLCVRMKEHAKTEGSALTAVGQHLADNPDHVVNTHQPFVLGAARYHHQLLIKEALYIQEYKPDLNIQVEARKLHVFNV